MEVLELLYEKPTISQTEIAAALGWKKDRAKYYLNKMKQNGIVRRTGSSQKGRWELLISVKEWRK